MIRSMLLLLMFQPVLLIAQIDTNSNYKGIRFENELTWEQVMTKAKAENKFVFVDCYATWCAPCKLMDKQVYPQEKVGSYLNSWFISIKIQMDTSKQDDESIKKRYSIAHSIQQQFKVNEFPTYLFFSPDGKIIHREKGAIRDTSFLKVAANALNPDKQYYTLLEKYKQGNRNYKTMAYLAYLAKKLDDAEMATAISQDYMLNYLYKLDKQLLYTKENIEFLNSFLRTSKEKGFKIFYSNSHGIDSVMGSHGYAFRLVKSIIIKEELENKIRVSAKQNKDPDWTKINNTIKKKYNEDISKSIVLDAQIDWYSEKKDWEKSIMYNVKKIEQFGLDTSGFGKTYLNNMIYEVIFRYCSDTEVLKKAIQWMEIILKGRPNVPQFLDTYANLLYKSGRTAEAIAIQLKASELAPKDNGMKNTLVKMQKGEPTWPIK